MQFVFFCIARVAVALCVGLISSTADGCGGTFSAGKCGIVAGSHPPYYVRAVAHQQQHSSVGSSVDVGLPGITCHGHGVVVMHEDLCV
jgi:hypothetical protein